MDAFTRGQPALLYHKIDWLKRGVRRRGLYMSPTLFRRQMQELRAAGFCSAKPGEAPSAGVARSVVVTFDDGFWSVLENAVPVLHECGFRAMQFIVPGLLGKTNVWDQLDGERPEPLMDAAGVREWLAAGHAIGAHTMTHPRLTCLPRAAAREEIVASRKALEDEFQQSIRDFAYPFGDFDSLTRELVAEAGFERAWTVEPGVNDAQADPLTLLRYPAMVSLRRPTHLFRSIRWPFGRHR
ncbi:MAG: polysaccharide deacetylase family protein [Verrucomicrobiota bacterium]|nr:polysaccharide deacetylase family protein [Verrucomicrobiota bacterium]